MRRQQQKLSGELTILLDSLVVFKDFLRDHDKVELEVILCIVYVKSGVDADHISACLYIILRHSELSCSLSDVLFAFVVFRENPLLSLTELF